MQAFLEQLHSNKQKWVPIVDPGIKLDPGYPAYDEGIKAKAFVQDFTGRPYLGQVLIPACLLHACACSEHLTPLSAKAGYCSQLLGLPCTSTWQQKQALPACRQGLYGWTFCPLMFDHHACMRSRCGQVQPTFLISSAKLAWSTGASSCMPSTPWPAMMAFGLI